MIRGVAGVWLTHHGPWSYQQKVGACDMQLLVEVSTNPYELRPVHAGQQHAIYTKTNIGSGKDKHPWMDRHRLYQPFPLNSEVVVMISIVQKKRLNMYKGLTGQILHWNVRLTGMCFITRCILQIIWLCNTNNLFSYNQLPQVTLWTRRHAQL